MSGSSTLASAVVRGIRLNDWKMKPILRPRTSACWSSVRVATSVPSSRYSPRLGTSRQPRMFIRVDLPDPDEPITATYSPADTLSDTPLRACTAVPPPPYVLVTPRRSIRVSAATVGSRELSGLALDGESGPAGISRPARTGAGGAADRALDQLDPVVAGQARGDLGETVTANSDLHLPGPTAVGQGHCVRRTGGGDGGARHVKGVCDLRRLDRDVGGLPDPGAWWALAQGERGRVRHHPVGGHRDRRDGGQGGGEVGAGLGIEGHRRRLLRLDPHRVGLGEGR